MSPESRALRISTMWRTCMSPDWPWMSFVGSPSTSPRFTTSMAALITPRRMAPRAIRTLTARSQRAQERVDKYREGYVAPGMRHAFLPAIGSTSGRIHGDLLRLLYILAGRKTTLHFQALGEAVDVDSEAYCWRRSGFFWRMRASLGFACAQATTLSSQVFGKGNPRSRAGRPRP